MIISERTYDQQDNHKCREHLGVVSEAPDVAMVDLVDPESGRCTDEEQRELDGDREHEDEVVNAVDRARSANALERLPSERLSQRNVSAKTEELSNDTNLHQPPAEERRDEKGEDVQCQTRNFSIRAVLPVFRKEVDATSTLRSKSCELVVERLRVGLVIAVIIVSDKTGMKICLNSRSGSHPTQLQECESAGKQH